MFRLCCRPGAWVLGSSLVIFAGLCQITYLGMSDALTAVGQETFSLGLASGPACAAAWRALVVAPLLVDRAGLRLNVRYLIQLPGLGAACCCQRQHVSQWRMHGGKG